jgi:hypothetical protein
MIDIDDLLEHDFGGDFNTADTGYEVSGPPFSIEDYDINIGDPDGSGHISQTTGFTCAVVSQQMILNDFGVVNPDTGEPFSEAQLVYDATIHGWLNEGTIPEDMGNLLQYHGVDCHQGSGIENMVEELARGHKVIVGVDATELWNQENDLINDLQDIFIGESANHAIVVKGIKHNENGEPIVVINDPGLPDGAGDEYPLDVFHDAFQDSGCFYVATDDTPPGLASHMLFGSQFDPEAGLYSGSDKWIPDQTETTDISLISKTFDMLSEQERDEIMRSI